VSLSEAIRAAAGQAVDAERTPVQRERLLRISFEAPTGQTLSAAVVSRVLDSERKLARDRACASLAAPSRFDDLPEMSRLRLWMLATVSQALVEPPAWLDHWCGESDALLTHIFAEVSAHERAFFRLDMGEGEGAERAPVVVVDPLEAPAPPVGS
jgi:hypothetical protein